MAEALPKLILGIDFPKKMRWADLDILYARPLQWVVAMIDHEVIPFYLANLTSGNRSAGHRQLDPRAFTIPDVKDYLAVSKKHFVMVDPKREGSNHSQTD